MGKNIGVLLSGCGFLDGAEIHEAVLTLLAIDQHGWKAVCCAPNAPVAGVVNHRTRKPSDESRNVLDESARIARGDIRDAATVSATELDALIIPGGFGAAKNLCTFAKDGANCTVHPEVRRLVTEILKARKPLGAICIAPALVARIAGDAGVNATLTIGDDPGTANAIATMGCTHENCTVTEIAFDEQHRVVSTPAYMLGPGPAAVYDGIRKLVDRIAGMLGTA